MRFLLFLLAAMLSCLPVHARSAAPTRIVSIGLCTDQLLLLLAEREQIASLSTWAVDANMSYMIDSVGDIPLNNASVEEVVAYQPDLILANRFAAWDTTRFLRRLGYTVHEVEPVDSVADIYTLLREVGELTGNSARAEMLISGMRAELAAIEKRYAGRAQKSVIVYAPNGFTVGANTLEDDLFRHAGYHNLATELGIEGYQPIALETLLAADPDVLQIDRDLSRPDSLATAYVGHPVLERFGAGREDLDIPVRLRICGGPMIVEAVEIMAKRR